MKEKEILIIACKSIDCNMELFPFAALTASTLLGKLPEIGSVSVGMCNHSFCRAFISSGTDAV